MDYYSKLITLMSKEELEDKLVHKIEEYHGYLSREAAVILLAKEQKIYKKEIHFSKINEIKKSSLGLSIKAKVISINPTNFYPSGKRSREALLKDETGTIPFVLWEKNIQLLTKIRLNDEVEINNAYERNGKLGLRYGGRIKLSKEKGFTPLDSLSEKEPLNIRGFVSEIEGINKTDNSRAHSFFLSNGETERKIIVLQGFDRVASLEKEDEVILENVRFNGDFLGVYSDSRIFIRRPKNIITGTVEDLSLDEEDLKVIIGGKEFIFKESNIYRFLCVKKSDHLSLETLIKLKREFYIERKVFIKFKNMDGDSIIDSVSILKGDSDD